MDYYNLLGIAPQASPAEVQRAFRARAKAVHPDAHPDVSPAEREVLRRRFILLAQAYETLSDPARRAAYDRRRPVTRSSGTGGPRREGRPGGSTPGGGPAAAGSAGWRSTEARFGQARRAARAEPAGGDTLEDLLRDVEGLLGRFGLELRPTFEALLEALLDWARTVFRQVMGSEAAPGAEARSGDGAPRADAGQRARGRDTRSQDPKRRTAAGRATRRDPDAAWVEAELEALRQRMRRGRARPAQKDDVEAELRRLKERLRRPGG